MPAIYFCKYILATNYTNCRNYSCQFVQFVANFKLPRVKKFFTVFLCCLFISLSSKQQIVADSAPQSRDTLTGETVKPISVSDSIRKARADSIAAVVRDSIAREVEEQQKKKKD